MKLKKEDAKRLYADAPEWLKNKLREHFGIVLFSNFKDIKTFEDACMVLGKDPKCVVYDTDTKDEAAYKKLKVIIEAINGDWEPDWNNSNQQKWWPWFVLSSGFGFSYSYYGYDVSATDVGSRLCFESKEKSTYAAKQFSDVYKDFLT